ncbi:MAG: hypothetical protein L0332_06510 [Chloroflexi bacterium]|nr:hypothetical protein [Chloroflexota bacterium]MCI0575831.1 hypothetical protein [Chloroflexota bacterium]MCI0646558.1 hypothetical protein [Chloroflexota bacterium]MCI0726360.1 hypothetical protein [Chloroflexota bacterium]
MVSGIAGTLLVAFIGFLAPAAIDGAVAVSLFIPDKLGLVDHVAAGEIVAVRGAGDHQVFLPRSGSYRIYSPEVLVDDTSVIFTSHDSGYLSIALPIDKEPFAGPIGEDTPQFLFDVEAAGPYTATVTSPRDDVTMTIQPYVGNQNATVAVLGGIVQVATLFYGGRLAYYLLNRKRIDAEKVAQGDKREQMADFLDEARQKKRR